MSEVPHAAPFPRAWVIRALQLETAPDEGADAAAGSALDALAVAAASEPAPDAALLTAYTQRLHRVRLSSPMVGHALSRLLARLVAQPGDAVAAAQSVRSEIQAERQALINHAEPVFRPGLRLLTLGDHPLVRTLLLKFADRLEAVVVSEGRPTSDGVRLASALAEMALPARLITEAQLALELRSTGMALAAAERVLPNGDVVARVGTALLAQLCAAYRVPLFIAAPQAVWVEERDPLAHFAVEQRSPTAVLPVRVPGVEVSNAPFDLTPGSLVAGYLAETGIIRREG